MDNNKIKNTLNTISNEALAMLPILDNQNLFKLHLGILNSEIEKLNSYTIARDKY